MADQVDEVRSRIDIVDLVGQRVALKRAGKDWKGLCPFHEDRNPSFQVSPALGRYRCWSCGESGDAFTWVMKTQNVDFAEALRILADRVGVTLKRHSGGRPANERAQQLQTMADALAYFREQFGKAPHAQAYCRNRKLDDEVLAAWEIGYAPDEGTALASHLRKKGHSLAGCKALFLVDEDPGGGYFDKFRGRLIFPIRDEKGDLVAFGGRMIGDGQPKYINSSDTPLYRKSRVLYGMHRAKDTIAASRKAVLVEGYLDVIACHRAGVTSAVASLGTSLAEDQAKLLKRWCDGVVILYDSDAAGQKAAARAIEVLEQEGLKVRVAAMAEGEDPDTLLDKSGPTAVQDAVKAGIKPIEYRLELLRRRVDVSQEEFWSEALAIVATAPNERDLEVHIMRLAPLYPHLRDKVAAAARLRADVMALRKPRDRRAPTKAVVGLPATREAVPLSSAERMLLEAFLEPELRFRAFEALAHEDLFETGAAADLAASIRASFSEPPVGAPAVWLDRIEPESCRSTLTDLFMASPLAPLTKAALQDSIKLLEDKREARRLRDLVVNMDDETRQEFLKGRKKLTPGT